MTSGQRTGALMIHPHGDFMGNILWPGELPDEYLADLPAALKKVTSQGYFASPFPEGDGITFKWNGDVAYDPQAVLQIFRIAFPFLDLDVLDNSEGQQKALARLASNRTVICRYLVPIEGLRLGASFQIGDTLFHAPVDGVENRLSDHAWRELCDVSGADVDPDWAPDHRAHGTTELLAHPLIERKIEAPLSAIYEAGGSFDSQSGLLRLVMEDADQALDPLRLNLCHYRRLEYLPAKPGWIGDTALVYLMPESRTIKKRFLQGKPYVLRVSNNWLGLEVDGSALDASSCRLADLMDGVATDEITRALKSALRALNRAFYLVELEASFLHLVYAIDALCDPKDLKGDRHRLWITALASRGSASRFEHFHGKFQRLYNVRNSIVHGGKTFANLGLVGEDQCQFVLEVLGSCIETFLIEGFRNRHAASKFAFDVLVSDPITPLVAEMGSTHFKLPLSHDKTFKKHLKR